MLEDKKWVEAFQDKVYEQSRNRDLWLNGVKVAQYKQTGNFTRKWFEAEQPELTQQYTRLVTKEELDTEAIRRDHPELWEKYRAPTMLIENNPIATP